jgi:hypothetical protein
VPGDGSASADIWHCNCLNVFHVTLEIFESKSKSTAEIRIPTKNLILAGEPVSEDELPKFLTIKHSEDDCVDLHDFFTFVYPVISERFRDFLLRFDIGDTRFVPIDIYQSDGVTKRAETYFILNIVSQKECLVPEETHINYATKIKDGFWLATPMRKDYQLAVRASAREGADLWVDPRLRGDLFFSDGLCSALMASDIRPYSTPDLVASLAAGGLTPCFEVARCKIVDAPGD